MTSSDSDFFLEALDLNRGLAFESLDKKKRAELGQYSTPVQIAKLMASFVEIRKDKIKILDPGAGVGSLSAALIQKLCTQRIKPEQIHLTAIEIDPDLIPNLCNSLESCKAYCAENEVLFSYEIIEDDFVQVFIDSQSLISTNRLGLFDVVVMNPPYKKINKKTDHYKNLSSLGIDVTNIYAGFLALSYRLLRTNGQAVSITPRSFCNGIYFSKFRRSLLEDTKIKNIHVFDSRREVFSNEVLQESIILNVVKSKEQPNVVTISSSSSGDDCLTTKDVDYNLVVPSSSDASDFIHLITNKSDEIISNLMDRLNHCLADLGIQLSTGKVVPFRSKEHLQKEINDGDVPLLYPNHLKNRSVSWPLSSSKKPNAIALNDETKSFLIPPGKYVLLKRFSSKEQQRRVEAYYLDTELLVADSHVAIENHINYFHINGNGLSEDLALGLLGYLNSKPVDMYFRLFSGNTQVNATDMRQFPFPSKDVLIEIGCIVREKNPKQNELDDIILEHLSCSPKERGMILMKDEKIKEASSILKKIGMDKRRQNSRSSMIFLVLAGINQTDSWENATSELLGITGMMELVKEWYGEEYKPNTRETFRRQTIHQFVDAGIVLKNPDDPDRATNSKDTCYCLSDEVLNLIKHYGQAGWEENLSDYLENKELLREKYAQRREQRKIKVVFNEGVELDLSPGGQNVLVEKIINDFLPRFVPGATVVHVGDTADKQGYLDKKLLGQLGLEYDLHGKFPDVIALYEKENWLLLIEAVTSHGPVDAKRYYELKELFEESSAGLVYVTTFLDNATFSKYLGEIAWETEVWIAEQPTHMIHFDGKRFLGPYE